MKNTGLCAKCLSADVIRIEGDARAYGAGNNIQTGLTKFSAVLVHRYLCCRCGFTEEWIDKEDIDKLKRTYS